MQPATRYDDVLTHLGEHGPALIEDIATAVTRHVDDVAEALADGPFAELEDDRWVSMVWLFDGLVLTHRLTEVDLFHAELNASTDLVLWDYLLHICSTFPLEGGGHLVAVFEDHDESCTSADHEHHEHHDDDEEHEHGPHMTGIAGPEGWLDGFAPGDLIALRLQNGGFEMECLGAMDVATGTEADDHAVGHERIERIERIVDTCKREATRVLQRWLRAATEDPKGLEDHPWPGADLVELLTNVMFDDPDLLVDPLPPLTELLDAAGLEWQDELVGLAGTPWDGDLSREEIFLTCVILTTIRADQHEGVRTVATGLTMDPDVLSAAMGEAAANPPGDEFVRGMLEAADRPDDRASTLVVAAFAAEGRADAVTAHRRLLQAIEHDTDVELVYRAAGEYAVLAGTADDPDHLATAESRREAAAAADALLVKGGVAADDGLRPLLQRTMREPAPLVNRMQLLLVLLMLFTRRGRWRVQLGELFDLYEGPDWLERCSDLMAIDGGCLGEFIAQRGRWLLDDERALLARWQATRVQLYEVADRSERATLRALADDEQFSFGVDMLIGDPRPGDLYIGRLLPSGDERPFAMAPLLPVDRSLQDQVLGFLAGNPTPEEIVCSFSFDV